MILPFLIPFINMNKSDIQNFVLPGKFFREFIAAIFILSGSVLINGQSINTDVLVINGSTSGVSAGIQAARMGVNTLIVEETSWLGGMLTSAGVSAVDGNHDLQSGIWKEFRDQLILHYGSAQALATGWVSNTLFEPRVGDSIFKAMVRREKKLSAIYGFHLIEVLKRENRVVGAVFENDKHESLLVNAKVVIDATDLGDGLKMAGAEYDLGIEARATTGEQMAPETAVRIIQDLTWVAVLKDYGQGADMTIEKPSMYDPTFFKDCCPKNDHSEPGDCIKMLNYGRLPNNKFMLNWPIHGNDFYIDVVEMNWEQRKQALEKARQNTLCFVYHIQHVLGLKNLGLADDEFPTNDKLALIPYHREGRRLKGIVRFTVNEALDIYNNQPLYRTGISVGDYPVDHHHNCRPDAPKIKFPPVPSFNIPLGALIPEKIDGLIVSDKAISVSNIMNGATRLQPCVLLTGQAAGALAALSVADSREVREVPVRKVQTVLLDNGAYLVPLYDVKYDDPHFISVQRIILCGILKVKGEPYSWENRTWFFPDSTITVQDFTIGLHTYNEHSQIICDSSTLTAGKCLEFLSMHYAINDWNDIAGLMKKKFNIEIRPDHSINKREISVLLDLIIGPFENKQVDFYGKFKN